MKCKSTKWREFLEADFFSPEPDLQPEKRAGSA
jgi:hypothetical protein